MAKSEIGAKAQGLSLGTSLRSHTDNTRCSYMQTDIHTGAHSLAPEPLCARTYAGSSISMYRRQQAHLPIHTHIHTDTHTHTHTQSFSVYGSATAAQKDAHPPRPGRTRHRHPRARREGGRSLTESE